MKSKYVRTILGLSYLMIVLLLNWIFDLSLSLLTILFAGFIFMLWVVDILDYFKRSKKVKET
ncbi:hypothetical protein RYX45_06055 [Alkalihalophilus pseudofirmus]|uniref:Uncharacterized protein n=1 Tax=Alkalihalophilus pseudofirmus TaxID=79885 RepID=A0AAJ2NLR3_ALKPS|nr:hypothetical protein [Alkalihalophilus pseudofirmus]MDV2884733.1 hypothetical protein [Alkalihalophilus pseudofirmus]